MTLLFIIGNYFLWALLTILSGCVGGFGLALGFHSFKKIKDLFKAKKNKNYLNELEQELIASSQEI